jgi:hypothetical protein
MCGLKRILFLFLLVNGCVYGFTQTDSSNRAETTRSRQLSFPPQKITQRPLVVKDTIVNVAKDSLQETDSLQLALAQTRRDSLLADSVRRAALPKPYVVFKDTSTYRKYQVHPYLPMHRPALYMLINYHQPQSKDELFYLMAGVIFIMAFIRLTFSKYFRNLFLLFFQTSIRQKQTRDQLLQDNLASLLMNLLFVITGGLYITLLVRYKSWTDISFWWLAAGSGAVLLLVYLGKYLFLLFTGWVFNTKEAAGSYVFVVFLVNKVLGVLLIPFLLILAFAEPVLVQVGITLSAGMICLLLGYRYWVSFMAIRNKLKVNALHFLLYLCAVELLPLALICKVLMNYFNGSL